MSAEIDHAWPQLRSALRQAVGDRTFSLWIEPLRAGGLDGNTLTLLAPDETAAWVRERLGRVLQTCAAAVLGPEVVVDVTTSGARDAHPAPAPPAPAPARRRSRLAAPARTAPVDPGLNPKYTFDQFVIGDSNRLAHAAALSVAEIPAQAYNPLFIYGPPGLGKTHLLHSIANYVTAFGGGLTVRYTTVEAFTSEFVDALGGGSIGDFKTRFRNTDVLLIDDVEFLERKVKTEEELFHTFNALYDANSQLVLTSDRMPSDLAALEDRLRERFESGLVTDIGRPDYATRLAILRKRASHDNLTLADESALEVIAGAVTANVRTLEGALIRVVAFASLTGRPVDAQLAREVVANLSSRPGAGREITIALIQAEAARLFGISREQLLSRNRSEQIAWPRQLAMYVARELTDQSLPAIGREFGDRDHTTVLNACRRAAERIASDPEAYSQLAALNAACAAG